MMCCTNGVHNFGARWDTAKVVGGWDSWLLCPVSNLSKTCHRSKVKAFNRSVDADRASQV